MEYIIKQGMRCEVLETQALHTGNTNTAYLQNDMQTDTSYDAVLKSEFCHSEVQLHDNSTALRKVPKTGDAALWSTRNTKHHMISY
jgi:hypothetical protein